MLNPILRRIQRYQRTIKLVMGILILLSVVVLVLLAPPETLTIVMFLTLVFLGGLLVFAVFLPTNYSTLAAFTIVFFLTLRFLGLFNTVNVGLYLLFLLLLASYLKRGG